MTSCPSRELLCRIVTGELPGPEASAVLEHVRICQACQIVIEDVSDDAELRDWKQALKASGEILSRGSHQDLVDRILRATLISDTHDASRASTDRIDSQLQATSIPVGSRLGPYELVQEIGRGGMGVVFKARDVELERWVALKVVYFDDAEGKSRARFVREAQAAARVKHDHVVTVHAVGTIADGSPYLIMEFVQGTTLRHAIGNRGPLPPRESAELIAQAASGLQAIHDAGLVHCDVKSSNILLDSRESPVEGPTSGNETASSAPRLSTIDTRLFRAKISDFGLARLTSAERTMSMDGNMAGTPNYMSPEQLRGNAGLDGRSDVYSLGVTLYEALTGTLPFTGTPHMVLRQIESQEPRRPSMLNDAVPRDLETICLKAMAKQPGRRYPAPREFAADLQRWLKGEPILARPVGSAERTWRWCQRNPRIAFLSSIVLFLLLFSTVGSVLAVVRISAEQRATKKEQQAADEARVAAQKHAVDAQLAQRQAESLSLAARQQRNLALAAHVNLVRGVQDRLADTPGTLALRKQLLESAVAGLEKIVREASSPDDRDRTLFLAHQRLGEVYFVLGRTTDSRSELEQAHKLAAQLYERQPDDPVAQDDLAAAYTSLGEFNVKILDYKAAQAALDEALRLLDQLPPTLPDGTVTSTRRIRVLSNWGDAALRLNDSAAAEEKFRQASTLAEELRADQHLDSQSRRIADSVLRRLGDVALIRGELGRGVDYYQRSLDSAEDAGLAEISLLERHGLVDTYGRLGLVLTWLGESTKAEACFRQGIELNAHALRVEPENHGLARKSAVFDQRLGDISWSRGDYAAMRQHLLAALDRHRQLRDRDAASLQTQNDLVVCLEQLARLEVRLEKYREAGSWYDEASSILRARKEAGTLTDPVSIGFAKSFELAREILVHLPAAMDAAQVPENIPPVVAASLVAERAVVFARRGNLSACDTELGALANHIEQLAPVDRSNLQLAAARAAALAARHVRETSAATVPPADATPNRLQHFLDLGVAAIEKFVAADPFNATYLRFEYELRALDGHPRFEQLFARFRNPQATASSPETGVGKND